MPGMTPHGVNFVRLTFLCELPPELGDADEITRLLRGMLEAGVVQIEGPGDDPLAQGRLARALVFRLAKAGLPAYSSS